MAKKKAVKKKVETRGAPAHKPTATLRELVENLVINGASHDTVARHVGVTKTTLYKHYRDEIDCGVEILCSEALVGLRKLISECNLGAICFALKCKGKWKEKETEIKLDLSDMKNIFSVDRDGKAKG